jgi:Xaa-Pro aminopeptidase
VTSFARRRHALLDAIDTDAFLVIDLDRLLPAGMDAVSLYYLSGYSGEGALIVGRQQSVLLTDHRYLPRAAGEAPDLRIVEVENSYLDVLTSTIDAMSIEQLGFSARRMNHSVTMSLDPRVTAALVPLEDPVAGLRVAKDSREIEAIRAAIALTEASLAAVIETVEIGTTEQEIATRLKIDMLRRGATDVAFESIIAAGRNSYTGHHQSGDRAIREGDFLLCDVGARVGKYNADMTRTFAVGEPSEEMREIYQLALDANRAGIAAIRPGAAMRTVNDAIREVFSKSPLERRGRIAGHGLGLDVHERPYLRRDDGLLAPGMVMTVEPGVYLPEVGGVRIEDVVAVTDDGREVLTTLPKDELIRIA